MDTKKPQDVKDLVVDLSSPESVMKVLRSVLRVRRFGQARILLSALQKDQTKNKARPKKEWLHSIAILTAKGFYTAIWSPFTPPFTPYAMIAPEGDLHQNLLARQ